EAGEQEGARGERAGFEVIAHDPLHALDAVLRDPPCAVRLAPPRVDLLRADGAAREDGGRAERAAVREVVRPHAAPDRGGRDRDRAVGGDARDQGGHGGGRAPRVVRDGARVGDLQQVAAAGGGERREGQGEGPQL